MKKLWLAFVRGLGNTLGIAQVRRHVPTPAEDMEVVADELRQAVEWARDHDRELRSWRKSNETIVGEAVNQEAVELLKNDPDEYFRRRNSP